MPIPVFSNTVELLPEHNAKRVRIKMNDASGNVNVLVGSASYTWVVGTYIEVAFIRSTGDVTNTIEIQPDEVAGVTLNFNSVNYLKEGEHARVTCVDNGVWDVEIFNNSGGAGTVSVDPTQVAFGDVNSEVTSSVNFTFNPATHSLNINPVAPIDLPKGGNDITIGALYTSNWLSNADSASGVINLNTNNVTRMSIKGDGTFAFNIHNDDSSSHQAQFRDVNFIADDGYPFVDSYSGTTLFRTGGSFNIKAGNAADADDINAIAGAVQLNGGAASGFELLGATIVAGAGDQSNVRGGDINLTSGAGLDHSIFNTPISHSNGSGNINIETGVCYTDGYSGIITAGNIYLTTGTNQNQQADSNGIIVFSPGRNKTMAVLQNGEIGFYHAYDSSWLPGNAGDVITSQGAGYPPQWAPAPVLPLRQTAEMVATTQLNSSTSAWSISTHTYFPSSANDTPLVNYDNYTNQFTTTGDYVLKVGVFVTITVVDAYGAATSWPNADTLYGMNLAASNGLTCNNFSSTRLRSGSAAVFNTPELAASVTFYDEFLMYGNGVFTLNFFTDNGSIATDDVIITATMIVEQMFGEHI